MNKLFCILLALLSIGLIGCSDNDNDNVQEFRVYSHLEADSPTRLNSIANLSSYIDLEVNASDTSIAVPDYTRETNNFIIIPKKIGTTIVTVKEKNKLIYKINVIVEYEGAGNWDIKESKITIDSDADIKDEIEQDVLKHSLFFDKKSNSFFTKFFVEYRGLANLSNMGNNKKYLTYRFIKNTREYEFTPKKNDEEQYLYKFEPLFMSEVGSVGSQHKIGIYYVDKTQEYKKKFPNRNVTKVTEEQKVECYYPVG